jgi:hypothetical protein
MPFQKGRAKTGGRKHGSHNKISREVAELLGSLWCNPIEGMARIATDPKVEVAIRARMYAELAKYVHPQLKAVDHSGSIGEPHDEATDGSPSERILRKLSEMASAEDSTGAEQ